MRLLAKIYLSLEKLITNPAQWFGQKNWLVRYLIVILLVPPISIMSLLTYTTYTGISMNDSYQLLLQNYEELISLRERVKNNNITQLEEIAHLNTEIKKLEENLTQLQKPKSDTTGKTEVLGTTLPESNDATTSSKVSDIVHLVNPSADTINIYEEPDSSSAVVTTLESNSIHFYLDKQSNWYQLDLSNHQVGWVESKYARLMP